MFYTIFGSIDQLIQNYLSPESSSRSWRQTFADNMASNLDDLRGSLMKELECPVCLEVPETTPIFQCSQGHIHCNACHPKLNNCPICRSPIQMDSRNVVAEKMHEKLLQSCHHENCSVRLVNIKEHESQCDMTLVECSYCQNNVTIRGLDFHEEIECEHRRIKCPNTGCPLEIVAKESQEHEQQCEYRQIQCIVCQKNVPRKLLVSHIMKWHTSHYYEGSEVSYKLKIGHLLFLPSIVVSNAYLLKAYQHSFLVMMELTNNIFSCYVSILGSAQDAAKFNVNVMAFHPDQKNVKMEGQGPVDTIESGKTIPILSMSIERLKNMIDDKGRYCFRLKVQYDSKDVKPSKESKPSKLKKMVRSLIKVQRS